MSKKSLKNDDQDMCYIFTELVVNTFADLIDEAKNGTLNVTDASY